jgi:hypothetical protein
MSRKTFTLPPYSGENLRGIEKRVAMFEERYPQLDPTELKIREVISRFKGEAGLTESKVLYLTGCILRAINGTNDEYVREQGPNFHD